MKSKQKKKTYLVTGSAGFIGFYTVKRLLELGNIVVGIDNLNNYYDIKLKNERNKILLKNKDFKFIKCDLANYQDLEKKLGKYKFEKIIHLGAQAGVRYSLENPFVYVESNYIGTMHIFEFAKVHKIPHVIYASTSSVYGKNEKQPFEESHNTDSPISVYAATKKATEVMAHAYGHLFGIQTTGLRFFTVYGPWGRPDMALFKFVKNILEGKEITIYNKGKMARSFTYVEDIVDGIIGSMKAKKKFAIYNVGGGKVVQLMDFISIIEKKLGKTAKKKFLPMQAGDIKETVASTKLSEKEINYKAKTSIDVGVENFVAWFLDNQKWLLKLKPGKQ